jgi:hypothetical protein
MVDPIGEESTAVLEKWLTEAAPQADPDFQRQLRAQLLEELRQEEPTMIVRNRAHVWRLAGAAAALALLLFLILTPAGEALAELLSLGWYRFTNEPTLTEERIAEPVEDAGTVRLETQRFATAAEASGEAGFQVLAPTYAPEGYLAEEAARPVELVLSTEGAVRKAVVDYMGKEGAYLAYEQVPYDPELEANPWDVGTGDAEPQPVTVNGADGVFFEGIVWGIRPDADGEPAPVHYNVLLWQQEVGGRPFMFWLQSSERLPLAELLRVAESLAG